MMDNYVDFLYSKTENLYSFTSYGNVCQQILAVVLKVGLTMLTRWSRYNCIELKDWSPWHYAARNLIHVKLFKHKRDTVSVRDLFTTKRRLCWKRAKMMRADIIQFNSFVWNLTNLRYVLHWDWLYLIC